MLEYPPRRSPSGQDTASTSCCASTPSASQGSNTKPCAGSRKPPCPMRTSTCHGGSDDEERRRAKLGHVLGTATRIWAPGAASSRTRQDQPLTTSMQVRGCFHRWWQVMGSNHRRLSRRFYRPLPLATRATCLVPPHRTAQ